MRLHFFDSFIAEGSPDEVSAFMYILFGLLKNESEKEKAEQARKDVELFEKLTKMTFNDLRRMELGEDEEE